MDEAVRTFDMIMSGHRDSLTMRSKLAELARNIDYSHKTAHDRLTKGKITEKDIPILEERLETLEWIARNIEQVFEITVLTSPRD